MGNSNSTSNKHDKNDADKNKKMNKNLEQLNF